MKRLAVIAAALGAVASFAAAAPAAPAGAKGAPYGAHLTRCHHALAPEARLLGVVATVHAPAGAVPATRRVGVRLHLLVRHAGEATFSAYAPPPPYTVQELGLDTWVRSGRGSRSLRYSKTFNNLDAPAAYRFKVSFRRYGAHGKVVRTWSRRTHSCSQPDLRPDLQVRNVVVQPAGAKRDRYRVFVRNRGKTAAGPFEVQLAVGGTKVVRRTVAAGLEAGGLTRVGFGRQPACDTSPPVVTLDPDAAVAESDEADNVVPVTCP